MIKLIIWALLLFGLSAQGQDTLSITLRQVDSLFLQRNLLALAGRYQIEAAQAQIIQARLLDNPTINAELNAYNPALRRPLDVGSNGQKAFSIQQTILLAGKRSKRVAVATEQARLTELQFADLLRSLRFDLRSRFYEIYFTQNTLSVYNSQRARLTETVQAFERQYNRNNVALRELVRLKALLLQLNNDQLELQNQLAGQQRDLRTLLQTTATIRPVTSNTDLLRYGATLPELSRAIDLAFENRPDLRGAEVAVRQADANLSLQKALATPDLRVGGLYDQNASYTPNYTAVTVSMDLPLLNKNQGNIRSARAQADYLRLAQRNVRTMVENEVQAALQQIQQTEAAYQSIDRSFPAQFDELNQGVLRNFERGNLSLIEFVDLFETYLQNVQQLNRLSADRINAYEQLNFTVGTDLFK
ncbi:TolC family protein [Spirosoma taeanense]|uniref:TolC family protein n=1 Tax=Spirosoma taeanense TaxID=2735870 RepID=A0A6M5Y8V3_9BACT|nr:TolC family protein [Spirosoma taeanense]QJW89924.1 TolC family protein [Spirosoma taeanense]